LRSPRSPTTTTGPGAHGALGTAATERLAGEGHPGSDGDQTGSSRPQATLRELRGAMTSQGQTTHRLQCGPPPGEPSGEAAGSGATSPARATSALKDTRPIRSLTAQNP
jgi:hypothetical protein